MKTAGIIIGVLMVGGAVVALSNNASASNATAVSGCTFPNATNYNPNATVDNGTCLFEKQEDSENYQQQKEEQREQEKEQQQQQQEQEELAEVDCSGFTNQDNEYREKISLETGSVTNPYAATHDLIKLKAKVGVGKTKYVVGEPVKIYIAKTKQTASSALNWKGYTTDWKKWNNESSTGGESNKMTMTVESNDEIYKLFNGSVLDSANNSSYNPINNDDWSFKVITLDTSTLNIKEPVNFKIYAKIDMNGHKDKSKTRESAFTVYPAGCATTKKAESYSHDEEIMSFQSFVYPW